MLTLVVAMLVSGQIADDQTGNHSGSFVSVAFGYEDKSYRDLSESLLIDVEALYKREIVRLSELRIAAERLQRKFDREKRGIDVTMHYTLKNGGFHVTYKIAKRKLQQVA